MLSHVFMGVSDLERVYAFHAPSTGALQPMREFREPGGMAGR